MRSGGLLAPLVFFASLATASQLGSISDLSQRDAALLIPRQNGNGGNGNGGGNGGGGNNPPVASSSQAPGNGNGNGNGGNNNDKPKSKYQTTKTFDARLPAGGVSMITPAPILGPQYYPIGNQQVTEYVTFAWNFTSLSITPSAVDVLASCSYNQATYTIAVNHTIAGKTQAVTWDTGEYAKSGTQLPMATYTLIVYDSDSSPDAIPRAGYLGTYNQLTFGMYQPKPYVPLKDYVCVTCNGAGSLERQTWSFFVGMVALTVLSFSWFTGVAGLW